MRYSGKISIIMILLLLACFKPAVAQPKAKQKTSVEPKPMVLYLFDHDCIAWNSKITPIINELEKEYDGKVTFVQLDCNPASLEKSKTRAKELGVLAIVQDANDYTPVVVILSSRHALRREFVGMKTKDDYKRVIDRELNPPSRSVSG